MNSPFDAFYPGDVAILLVFNVLIQITVVILLTMFVVGRFRRHAPVAGHAAWLACLLFVVVCPFITAAAQRAGLSMISLPLAAQTIETAPSEASAPVPLITTNSTAERESNSSKPGPYEVALPTEAIASEEHRLPISQRFGVAEDLRMETAGDALPRGTGLDSDELQPTVVRSATPLVSSTQTTGGNFRSITAIVVVAWAIGFLLLGIRLLHGGLYLWKLRRQTRPLDESAFVGVLQRVRRTLNVSNLPPILHSEQIFTPVVAGLFRPAVLLPASLPQSISENRLHDVLVHECAHLVRRDHWVGLLQRLVEIVYWPHPLVYRMNGQLARCREELCDNHVLWGVEPADYAETLLELTLLCKNRVGGFSSMGVFGLGWRLEDRVQGLLDTRRDRRMRLGNRSRLGVAACACLALAAAAMLQVGLADEHSDAESRSPRLAATKTPGEQSPKENASAPQPPAINTPVETSGGDASEKPLPATTTALATAVERTDFYGDPLPTGALARLGTLRYRHGGIQQSMAFLPGSHRLIASSNRYGIQLWDADTGKLWRPISPSVGLPQPFSVSADGRSVAALTATLREDRQYHNRLTVWNVNSREVQTEIQWTEPMIEATQVLAFTPDGKTIATGGRNGKLRFWDLQSKSELLSYVLKGSIDSIAFAPSGELSAVGTNRGVFLWRWRTDEPKELNIGPRGAMAVAFSPDGKWLASGSDERRGIRVWRIADRELAWQIDTVDATYYPNSLAFTPDSKLLAVPLHQFGRRVELREAETGKLVRSFDADQVSLRGVAISSDQQLIAGYGGSIVGGTFKVWRLETGEPLHQDFVGHEDTPLRLEFTPHGSVAVTAGHNGTVRVWDAVSGRQVHQMQHDDARPVVAVAVSPDGQWVASAGFDYAVRLWNMETGAQRYRLRGHGELGAFRSNAIRFTPDSSRFLSFGNDMYLRFWDVRTGKALQEFEIRPSNVEIKRDVDGAIETSGGDPFGGAGGGPVVVDAQLTSDCQHLLLKIKGEVHVIETSSGQEVSKFKLNGRLSDFAVSSDGKWLATIETQPQTRLQVRDYGSPDKVHCEIELPTDYGHALALSPTGDLVATSLYERLPNGEYKSWIAVWDTTTGEEHARIDLVNTTTIAFLPDGKRIASSSPDTTVLIWDLDEFSQQK
ncbi:MAG TPA: M56 family metallopeptidase [Pirellulaceae bacterium]|nr:M56 family metallopeptidase [Pirellulaceae bacterium]